MEQKLKKSICSTGTKLALVVFSVPRCKAQVDRAILQQDIT